MVQRIDEIVKYGSKAEILDSLITILSLPISKWVLVLSCPIINISEKISQKIAQSNFVCV
jgi:hypothetical protein